MPLIGRSREVIVRLLLSICIARFSSHTYGQRSVTFPLLRHPGEIQADLYGSGVRGVILAHGGRFNKESWKKQAQVFANAGFLVLAIRFRGDASNPDRSPGSFGSDADNAADVLAAVSYLHRAGVKTISAVGPAWAAMPSETRMHSPNRATSPALSSSDLRAAVPRKNSPDANCSSSPVKIAALPASVCPRYQRTIKRLLNLRSS